MYKIKQEIEDERSKEKHWFKFMFDKNSKSEQNIKSTCLTQTSEDDPQNCNNKEEKEEIQPEKSKEEKKLEELLKKQVKKEDQAKKL